MCVRPFSLIAQRQNSILFGCLDLQLQPVTFIRFGIRMMYSFQKAKAKVIQYICNCNYSVVIVCMSLWLALFRAAYDDTSLS